MIAAVEKEINFEQFQRDAEVHSNILSGEKNEIIFSKGADPDNFVKMRRNGKLGISLAGRDFAAHLMGENKKFKDLLLNMSDANPFTSKQRTKLTKAYLQLAAEKDLGRKLRDEELPALVRSLRTRYLIEQDRLDRVEEGGEPIPGSFLRGEKTDWTPEQKSRVSGIKERIRGAFLGVVKPAAKGLEQILDPNIEGDAARLIYYVLLLASAGEAMAMSDEFEAVEDFSKTLMSLVGAIVS